MASAIQLQSSIYAVEKASKPRKWKFRFENIAVSHVHTCHHSESTAHTIAYIREVKQYLFQPIREGD